MNFYKNIFAVGYNYYSRNDSNQGSRFGGIMIVETHILGLFFVLVNITRRIFNLYYDFRDNNIVPVVTLAIFGILMIYLLKYFSLEKSERIVSAFNNRSRTYRGFYNVFTVLSLILEYVIIALLLNKHKYS